MEIIVNFFEGITKNCELVKFKYIKRSYKNRITSLVVLLHERVKGPIMRTKTIQFSWPAVRKRIQVWPEVNTTIVHNKYLWIKNYDCLN